MTRTPTVAPDRPDARGPRVWWRGLSRGRRLALITIAAVLFLAVSGVLARYLSAENAERDDELALIEAEAKGDVADMLAKLSGCRRSPTCVAGVRADAADPRVRRRGSVKILQLESPTSSSLFGATGKTRIAWTVIGMLPIVQCVEVRRTGNFLTGIDVQLIGLSAPIPNEGKCVKPTSIERDEEEATEAERQ